VLDRERILARIDVLDGYLRELRAIAPATFEEYTSMEKRRACERLLQVSIECVIDISSLPVIRPTSRFTCSRRRSIREIDASWDYFPLREGNFDEDERVSENSGARIWRG
jgi:hypothetical protein